MVSLELIENVCRICLGHKVILDWNEKLFEFCSMSYKDCYYKYTNLKEIDPDCYPTNVCESCANELKNAHMFFEKALNSFNFLQVALTTKELGTEYSNMEISCRQSIIKSHTSFDEKEPIALYEDNSPTVGKSIIEDVFCLRNVYDNGGLAEKESAISSKEIPISKNELIEPKHFIDINSLEESAETLKTQQLSERCINKLTKSLPTKSTVKRKQCKSLLDTSLEQQLSESYDVGLLESSTGKICNKTRKCDILPDCSSEHPLSDKCNTKLPKSKVTRRNYNKKRKFESLSETLLEQQHGERCVDELTKSSVRKKAVNKRNVKKLITETALEQQLGESCVTKLTKSSVTMKSGNKRKKYESSADSSLENTVSECGDTEPQLSSTTKSSYKSREKYLLMCAYCSLKVHGAHNLQKHEAQHNENRKRTETCPQCGIKLYTKLGLKDHMKIHDQHRQKNQKCEFCEKAFFNKGALNVHRRIHLGLMIKCQLCPKEFFRQVDLNKHLLKHSVTPVDTNIEKIKYVVQCQYCNKSVLTSKWKEHKAVHMDQPVVKCKICEKNFFARNKCVKHLGRFHRKSKTEYEDFIQYYADRNTRTSILLIKQQETVQPLIE